MPKKKPPKVHINFSQFDPLRLPGPNLWILKKSHGKICVPFVPRETTLPKFNMELENHPLEKGKTSSKPPFLGSMLVFGWVYPLQVEQLARENIPSPKGKDRLPSNHRFFRGKLAVKLPGVYHLEDFRVWTPKKWRCFFYLAYLLVT